MIEATKRTLKVKNVESPHERRTLEHGVLDIVNLHGATVVRATLQPGWKWSTDVKPLVGTESCQAAHTGHIVSGHVHVQVDDGQEYDLGPGDAHVVGPGHDARVLGDEPCVAIDSPLRATPWVGKSVAAPAGWSSGLPRMISSTTRWQPSRSPPAAPTAMSSRAIWSWPRCRRQASRQP